MSPSVQPFPNPTTNIANTDDYVSLSLKLRKFSQPKLAVVCVVFACVFWLLLWLGYRRHAEVLLCDRDLGDKKSNSIELSENLVDFKASSYMKVLLEYWSLVSNFSQLSELVADGYV
jgi:hypothetical protein